jgi:hypothetical protein
VFVRTVTRFVFKLDKQKIESEELLIEEKQLKYDHIADIG